MELKYRRSESTVRPPVLEITKNTVYIRKGFVLIPAADEAGLSVGLWTYQEAALTPEEFNDYSRFIMAENAVKGVNDSDNIIKLMVGQESGDGNQLIIMEAIADLYDTISMIPGIQ